MRKNLFVRYFSICAAIILISVTFLGMMLLLFSARYFGEEKQRGLGSLLDEAALLSSASFNEKNSTFESAATLKTGFELMSSAADAVVFLTDVNGRVLLCSETQPCVHTDAQLAGEIMKEALTESGVSEQGNLNGLYTDRYYTVSQTLKLENGTVYGVLFASSSVDSLSSYLGNVATMFLISAAAVLVFAFVVIYFVTLDMVRPLRQMSAAMDSFAKGDFSARLEVTGSDEISELSAAINNMAASLAEQETTRRSFTANVSHELKTPIALIQGYAEGLTEGMAETPESRDYYCDVIMDEANKMNKMVKQLLTLTALEFGNDMPVMEQFDIVTLIKGILSSAGILLQQKGASVVFGQEAPVWVWADEFKIEEVVTNYLNNAMNHLEGEKRIEIRLEKNEDEVRIIVFNTGHHIPEEDIGNLWTKFYKVDKARTREYGGSGIGLSIVKAIMDSHNKDCGVENVDGGVEFWFTLDSGM